jgi:hypothetical protein
MTISNVITLDQVITIVRANEIDVAHLAGEIKVSKAALDVAKLPSYSNTLAYFGSNAGTDLKAFSKFWSKTVSGAFKQGLVAKGVSPACAKRISENASGAFRVSAELRSAAAEGAKAVEAWFKAEKITSERAIKGLSAKVVDPDEALARRLADLAPDRFSGIVERVRILKEIETRKTNGPNGVSKPGKAKPEVVAAEA